MGSGHTPPVTMRAEHRGRSAISAVALALLLAAPDGRRATAAGGVGDAGARATTGSVPPAAAAAPPPPFEPLLAITDPAELTALEEAGLDAATVVFQRPDATSLAARAPRWASIAEVLRADLAELYARDPRYGVGMRHAHRGFDPAWLASQAARFQLVAVVNRIDRRTQHPGTCGELRFVYRLAYATGAQASARGQTSRLPFTLNAVFFIADDGRRCAVRARALARPADVRALAQGGALTFKSLEVNLQTARWPSTVRPDLGGHADYLLRVFHESPRAAGHGGGGGGPDSDAGPPAGRLVPAALENMPDTDRIARTPALGRELSAWLRRPGVLAAIDQGTALLPPSLLATRAVSVTPRGLARPQNAPFRRLLRQADLNDLSLGGTTHVKTPAALLRRLDALSCVGCHQSRSLAGFHVIGAERDPARVTDAIAVALSPHLEEDLPRRRAYLTALAAGAPPDEVRPPAERGAGVGVGTLGHACGLGDPGFAAWTCASGHTCVAVDDDIVGQCMPVTARAGSACHPGAVTFTSDRIAGARTLACGAGRVCENVRVGFPGGMCASDCAALAEGEACGAIALLTPFNDCLARGETFAACARHARPAGLQACDARHPCRPDYLCARTQAARERGGGNGACLPPYFVLQMRVDGHQLGR